MKPGGLLIAIDYDGTFSRAPAFWCTVVAIARQAGHEVVLVTGRSDHGRFGAEVRRAVGGLMPIVFAGSGPGIGPAGGWKREAAKHAGYAVDIWVDDQPEYVGPQRLDFAEPKLTSRALAAMRAVREMSTWRDVDIFVRGERIALLHRSATITLDVVTDDVETVTRQARGRLTAAVRAAGERWDP